MNGASETDYFEPKEAERGVKLFFLNEFKMNNQDPRPNIGKYRSLFFVKIKNE